MIDIPGWIIKIFQQTTTSIFGFRLLLTFVFFYTSWKFGASYANEIPREIYLVLMLLASYGIANIVVNSIYKTFVYCKEWAKRRIKNNQFLTGLLKLLPILPTDQQKILISLLKGEQSFKFDTNGLDVLIEKKYIIEIHYVGDGCAIYRLSPLIKRGVKTYYCNKIKQSLLEYLKNLDQYEKEFLELFFIENISHDTENKMQLNVINAGNRLVREGILIYGNERANHTVKENYYFFILDPDTRVLVEKNVFKKTANRVELKLDPSWIETFKSRS